MENNIIKLKNKANKLPLLPGVYIMKNTVGEIIYVGKAKKLKNRVTQYFRSDTAHTAKVKKMVSNVSNFDYIVCDSEFEALTLENSLIKQYQPKYNILLKDDKGYHYIHISNEKWRRITAKKSLEKTGTSIGPYNSAFVVNNTVEQALKVFKLPNCTRNFEKYSKPCLNYHIGLCLAPCANKVDFNEYNEAVNSAIDFIKNGSSENIENLKIKMEKAAEQLNFEYAAKLRDRIESILKINQKQKVISNIKQRHDVFAAALVGETLCVEVFVFKNGHLCDENHYFFEGITSKSQFYNEFIPRYYAENTDIPRLILVDVKFDDTVITDWLSEKSGHSVSVEIPQKADKLKLVKMCATNAAEHLAQKIERNIKETSALNELAAILGINNPPRYIEAYDISNIAGSENVAGMVVFKDARPLKSAYRKFKINSVVGQDDYRSLAEVIERRLNEYKKGEDTAFSVLPDLILLDGGLGQLSAIKPVLEKFGLNIPVFGMVKDNKHKTNAIAASGGIISIKSNRSAFSLVTAIQDEVHRFAIGYHKQRRSGAMLQMELTNIEGIGKTHAINLIKHFKTINNIKSASLEELIKVEGIGLKKAEAVLNYFK